MFLIMNVDLVSIYDHVVSWRRSARFAEIRKRIE
jgi:hypothetical protein